MSNVVAFPRDYVLIDGGIVSASTDPAYIGRFVYFVDVLFADGGTLGVFDSLHHDEAIAAAAECEMPIIDRTAGGNA